MEAEGLSASSLETAILSKLKATHVELKDTSGSPQFFDETFWEELTKREGGCGQMFEALIV